MLSNKSDGKIHFSDLKQMALSPAHYRLSCESPDRESTRAMLIGSVADALIFGTKNVRYCGARRGTKEWGAFLHTCQVGDIVCNESEYAAGEACARAVNGDRTATELLYGCEYQVPLSGRIHGLDVSTRGVDALHRDGRYLIDLKITQSSHPSRASAHWAGRKGPHQLEWYRQLCEANGIEIQTTYLMCVESAAPHCVTVLRLYAEELEPERREIALWVEKLKACDAAGEWPGYVQSAVPFERGRWDTEETEEDE